MELREAGDDCVWVEGTAVVDFLEEYEENGDLACCFSAVSSLGWEGLGRETAYVL